jgi:nucleotide-binding universal stress UspA family protein
VHRRPGRAYLIESVSARTVSVIMGTRGLSDFSGLLLGSIAHKVIQHADCHVLVTR